MDVEKIAAHLENEDGLSRTLGMQFMSTPEPDTLMGKMTVDDRNKQPFGFLSGGATLALAENVAGVGSMGLCPGKMALGINVSGSHVEGNALRWHGDRLRTHRPQRQQASCVAGGCKERRRRNHLHRSSD